MSKTSKIVFEVESEYHKMLKMKALENDITLRELIVKALDKFLREELDFKDESSN